jgi:hypothetical protein
MKAEQLTTDLANRLNGIKVLKWEFDPEFSATSGKLTFWGKTTAIEIELADIGETKISLIPRILIGRLNPLVTEWFLHDIGPQAGNEDEAYDLVMATVRGIANGLK